MKLRLFLDEDVHAALSHALRQRGFDVIHAQELKRKGNTDFEQLAFAVMERRCLVTFNVRDFVILHNKYRELNMEHWGIIVSKQIPIGNALKKLLQRVAFAKAEDFRNRIEFM